MVVIFLAAGGLLYWQQLFGPVEQPIAFVLTGVEVKGPSDALLRYEDITRLHCTVLDEEANPVATIDHRRPGAVATPAPLNLPGGVYTFHVVLTLETQGSGSITAHFHERAELKGDKATIHL